MRKTAEYSGSAKMERRTDTTVHQDLLTTSRAVDVAGLTRCQSAAAMPSLLMKKGQNSSAHGRQQQGPSPSMLTLQIVGSTSCVLLGYQGSMDVPWELSSMLGQAPELMGSVLILSRFLSVPTIMEILSLILMSFQEMGSTLEDKITQKE